MDRRPSLDDLIALARTAAASDDPIDELAAAAALKSDLDELTDALLGHFVDQARRAGRSWSQIGEALGVTKQAAQQKHASTDSVARRILSRLAGGWQPGSRFTERARAAVVGADEAARRLGQSYVGTEHLLLGLFAVPDGIAARILVDAGVTAEEAEDHIGGLVGQGQGSDGDLPFTPRAKQAMELALREALDLGHNYLGTEHLLLGLLREGDGMAALFLTGRGLTLHGVRAEVVRRLTTGG